MKLPVITKDQIVVSVRWVIGTGGAFALGRGWLTQDQLEQIGLIALPVATLIWGWYANRQNGIIASAEVLAKVDKIQTVDQHTADKFGPKVVGPVDQLQPGVTTGTGNLY